MSSLFNYFSWYGLAYKKSKISENVLKQSAENEQVRELIRGWLLRLGIHSVPLSPLVQLEQGYENVLDKRK